ncbi:hypothetical protein [Nocardioides aurantiacus]|uniref:Uncharacterized protein n=1 Tax=Nocardioides aurantiacus TaxID=86796 RepID=A0A3N2CYC7_9ACTN|nr:hypothetical protein [Nocardioides aurantiacus]ROR92555.1 hypothetical protein EDD33_3446 [Nocardioides aurantiacus]
MSPPEVPDEFAAAYREAYERALVAQTDAARHRRPPQYRPGFVAPTVTVAASSAPVRPAPDVDLPERRGRLVVGTHRQEPDVLGAGEPWFDHVRDSRMFVPVLLATLALLLVLGAYVIGRAFTAAVGVG